MHLESLFSENRGLVFLEDGDNWGFHFKTMKLYVFEMRCYYNITRDSDEWSCEDFEVNTYFQSTDMQEEIEALYQTWRKTNER